MNQIKLQYIEHRLEFEKKMLVELFPEEIREQFKKEAYISGGCIYSLYHNNEPKDYDFFVVTNELVNRLREHFLKESSYKSKFKNGGMYKGYPLIVTDNAISVGRYQIITKWVGLPEEIVGQFDFKHNMFYFVNGKVHVHDLSSFDYLEGRNLVYNENRARDICGTIMRVNKFVDRGMWVSQREMSKMLLRLREVGFNDREIEILVESQEKPEGDHFGS